MSFSNGRRYLATPGPSIIPDQVLRAMQRPAPDIYKGEIIDITENIKKDISNFAETTGETVIYISNGHGVWEASLVNLFKPKEKVLVIANGHFGKSWAKLATSLGLNTQVLDFGRCAPGDPNKIEEILRADTNNTIKGLLVVQADTSTSVLNNLKEIGDAIKNTNHPCLYLVDSIASFGCDPVEMDKWGIDVLVTSCQKGLMTPPGLAYLVISKRAETFSKNIPNVSPYWDWKPRLDPEFFYMNFFGTAPTHLLYAQKEALKIMKAEGKNAIFARHKKLRELVTCSINHWGEAGPLKLNVPNESHRSNAVTTFTAKGHNLSLLREWVENHLGLTIGLSLGFDENEFLNGDSVARIGHMGHLNPHMLIGVISSLEVGLKACQIPHQNSATKTFHQILGK
ncbi:MAG: pyridoxal-phosphate-dependent aminotransferase family protein [Paracoccaceae bacterium]